MNDAGSPRRFNRFELKYIVGGEQRDLLLADVRREMAPDPHGLDARYRVTSLYYDSPDLACYRSKRDGIRFRRKVRVRWYGATVPELTTRVSLEIKQRIGRTTQKRRLRVPLGDAFELCAGETVDHLHHLASLDALDMQVANEIGFLARSLSLTPSCLVGYERHAFVGGPHDPGLRLTFDGDLVGAAVDGATVTGAFHHLLAPGTFVVECKSNEAVPLWVTRMLARHDVSITRYSKYCAAVSFLQRSGLPVPAASRTHG